MDLVIRLAVGVGALGVIYLVINAVTNFLTGRHEDKLTQELKDINDVIQGKKANLKLVEKDADNALEEYRKAKSKFDSSSNDDGNGPKAS